MSLRTRIAQARTAAASRSIDVAEAIRSGIACLDLTSLESTDSGASIAALAERAREAGTAAVCIYAPFLDAVRGPLAGSQVRTATVAMAFPHGQAPLEARLLEVELAVAAGFDEIDTVIPRNLALEGRWSDLKRELQLARDATKDRQWKVILESGELQDVDTLYLAARHALDAGADFVKTSTGKIARGADPDAVATLCLALDDHGQRRGVKVSGGVRTVDDYLLYYRLLVELLGDDAIHPGRARIGASSLLDALQIAQRTGAA